MCNEQRNRVAIGMIREGFDELRIPLRFDEGVPNLEPRDSIRITDRNAIVRAHSEGGAELVMRRWSWPSTTGRPVYNVRSDGRDMGQRRCLIVADGFYEFTDPTEGDGTKKRRKDKWLFTKRGEPWFCIGGIWRDHGDVGEAYAMLTTEPGPDIAPYHARQIVVVEHSDWARWLDPAVAPDDMLAPSPAGSFDIVQVG